MATSAIAIAIATYLEHNYGLGLRFIVFSRLSLGRLTRLTRSD